MRQMSQSERTGKTGPDDELEEITAKGDEGGGVEKKQSNIKRGHTAFLASDFKGGTTPD